MSSKAPKKVYAVKNNAIQEVDDSEVDFEMPSSVSILGSHANLVPMQSMVQAPRVFFGAKFYNQAMPVDAPEAPLVQNLDDTDKDGRSFDDIMGKMAGAVRSDVDGDVLDVGSDDITIRTADGQKKKVPIYSNFVFNRKSSITNIPKVKKGDKVTKGQLLAKSNYTDDNGTLAMGLNARIGLVPYKGYSMDDAVVISNAFAKRLASHHTYTYDQDFDDNTRAGLNHFVSLFPDTYTRNQIKNLDDNGVVKPGTVLNPGDPMILATKPKVISSTAAQLGKLTKSLRQARSSAATVWDEDEPGVVSDVAYTRNGVKVVMHAKIPTKKGDKITLRSGQKGVVSHIVDDEKMPRTTDGKPLEVLVNPQGIPSRVNSNMVYELLLGKIARMRNSPYKISSYTKPGEYFYDFVEQELAKAGITPEEDVFDPETNRKLENPITVGEGYIMKLHHTGSSKESSRSQGAYDVNQQPLKGGGEAAKSKRLSGLEVHSMLSAGAYANLREGSTLRGQKNDEYWRDLRSGLTPKAPGVPFVWHKFRALLAGAGLRTNEVEPGKYRLGPMTDFDLDQRNPFDLDNGDIVDPKTMEPVTGGLFDPVLVQSNRWGRIKLPVAVPNPAFEDSTRKLLGLTKKQFDAIMAGQMELPDNLRTIMQKKAADPVLYHGSPTGGLEELKPNPSKVLNDEKALFATPDRIMAMMAGAPWRDDDFQQGSVNGQSYMREMAPGNFDRVYKGKKGYIYHVPEDGFEADERLTKRERITRNKVKPSHVEEISDLWEALQREGKDVRWLKHGEKAPWDEEKPAV